MAYTNTAKKIYDAFVSDKPIQEKIEIIREYENSEEEFGLMHVPHSYIARAALIVLGHDEYERNKDIDFFIREFSREFSRK